MRVVSYLSVVPYAWWEVVAVVSAVLLAWAAVVIRTAKAHIDRRVDVKLASTVKDAVHDEIRNGLTSRMDRIENKIDDLVALHIQGIPWSLGDEDRRKQ